MSDPAVESDQYSGFVFQRLLDEVYLLMDYVSGRPDKSIADLQDIQLPGMPAAGKVSADDILTHISQLRFPPPDSRPINARNAAFLLLVKDKLNRLARPAIGMTIAYTAMVVGSVSEPVDPKRPHGKGPTTRRALAAEAYPGLIRSAKWLRYSLIAGLAALLLLTAFTAYTSGVAAFGKAMLDRLDDMHRARETILDSIKAIENAKSAETGARTDIGAAACRKEGCDPDLSAVFVRLCQRPDALAWRYRTEGKTLPTREVVNAKGEKELRPIELFENPLQPQLCDRLHEADRNWDSAYADLRAFERSYLYAYQVPVVMAAWAADRVRGVGRWMLAAPDVAAPASLPAEPGDSPQVVSAILSTFGTYILSACFTLLGAGVSIVRDLYAKVHDSTLSPRDLPLAWGRLALGVVAGAAIGLFYSPQQIPLQGAGGLTGSLTLSVQGLAFLAGYGVDSVFAVFDGLLRRLATAAAPPGEATPGR